MDFEIKIGLETHIQLKTKTKIFCQCPVPKFDSLPNTNICPVCSGQPGSLPVLNKKAIDLAIKAGLALNCSINKKSVFVRKNYFYPDMPKGYQITQFENPICQNGFMEISENKRIRIRRIHLEEDAGKSLHYIGSRKLDYTLIDFNRCGIPLIEIVSEPDINNSEEAYKYLFELHKLLKWLDISNCDMEKGEFRCDVNISVSKDKKVEIKNLNSFKAIREAISYEINRQREMILNGIEIINDTRFWDEKNSRTISIRLKEKEYDYRYFPEPDLPIINLTEEKINEIRNQIIELPQKIKKYYIEKYNLTQTEAEILTSNKYLNEYFSKAISFCKERAVKNLTNLIIVQMLNKINELHIKDEEIFEKSIKPEYIALISDLLSENKISYSIAKKIFDISWQENKNPNELLNELGLEIINSVEEIRKLVKESIEYNKKAFEDYKKGQEKASGPIIGFILRKTGGKADPNIIKEILKEEANRITDIFE